MEEVRVEEEERREGTMVWQITLAKPFLIGASDEKYEGLTS